MIKKLFAMMVVVSGSQPFLFAQGNDTITEKDVSRIIHYLASDSLKGRGNGRPELLKAGLFIGNEFRKNNLQPLSWLPGYFQPFRPFGGSNQVITDDLVWNGNKVPVGQFMYIHPIAGNYKEKTLADFKVMRLDDFLKEDILVSLPADNSDLLIWTDKKQPDEKTFLPGTVKIPDGGLRRNILLVYAKKPPASISLNGNAPYYNMVEYNVVGVLPGKSKPDEIIAFSAHYDHEGVYLTKSDSILNGANDDASGTTALLALMHYFSMRNDNQRTLLFCAFAGEELGLLGSADFVKEIKPEKIVAGINLEMIGVSQFGKNTVFIAGQKYSNLPAILQKGLKRSGINVRNEPDPGKRLFLRSDNYSFAMRAVPFHTIMASDDNDPCYHQPCDEIGRIDISNMTRIIKAIAASVRTLINGEATPKRIVPAFLPKND
jgi:hypothetical protein